MRGKQTRFLGLDFGTFSNDFAIDLLGCLRLSFCAILWAVRADFLSAAVCLGRSFFQPRAAEGVYSFNLALSRGFSLNRGRSMVDVLSTS